MKTCSYCGTQLPDHATVCHNCEIPCQVQRSAPPVQPYQNYYQPSYPAPKESISVGGWIGRSLIPMIPVVGSIVYIIMLFIWSGDTKKEDTFRNWAKAQLIIMIIAVALLIILFVLVCMIGMENM